MTTPPNPRELRTAERVSPPVNKSFAAETPGLSLGDVYFTLFRHKRKIIICALLGLVAAFGFYKTNKRVYQSEAKLFVRYVMESRTPGRVDDERSVKSPDPQGVTILNSELEIITSLDIAGKVVDAIGPDKFITPLNDGRDRDRAVVVFSQCLTAEVPPRSSVMQLAFAHTDPSIVQPVLRETINCYLKKHVEIHRSAGLVDDFLTQETEQLRSRLSQTEEDLRKAKSKLGFASIEDAKKSFAQLGEHLRQSILESETELAERSAFVRTMEASVKPGATSDTDTTPIVPDEAINNYGSTVARIEYLRKMEQELLTQFTPENSRVKETRAQLAEAEAARKKFETDYPSLTGLRPTTTTSGQPATDLVTETARLKAVQSKIAALNDQLDKLKSESAIVDQMEAQVVELNRKKELEESNYRKYAASLEQARLDDAMSSGHVSNISEIQSPSLPLTTKSKRVQIMLGLSAGGLALGLGWAFVMDLFFDRTIKRPLDIERKLQIPLFLSIPVVDRAFTRRLEKSRADLLKNSSATNGNRQLAPTAPPVNGATAQALQPFHATLRDRLIQYFDNENLVHKPKLVAVTGLSRHAGVTTTAAGLAQSLSETGEGNVLLVDMTAEQGSAQHYVKGKAVSNIEETLQTKDRALVQENLYVVTEGSSNSDRLSRNLPQRFTKLVPRLKASDFDYIIFDMPPVSQISVTPRLAGFMDMVLLVVESDKTNVETVEKVTAMLAQSKVHVGAVLNKTQNPVPKFLHNDPLGES